MATRDFDEHSITDAVVARFADTPDPRLKQIVTSLVRHAHDFVREVELTEAEWLAAVQFLTRTGQICSETRQEFILLSDTLGISMLVDVVNHRQPQGATETTVLGPFHVDRTRRLLPAARTSVPASAGTPLFVSGIVTAADGRALPGAHRRRLALG